ncbi:MAG: hypothetical protein ABJG78_05550 [Cyclobacteriaceae bacterium]
MIDSETNSSVLNARQIKSWVVKEFNTAGWSYVISSALPELLDYNSTFNCFNINDKTDWDKEEVRIIAKYLFILYQKKKELLDSGSKGF